MRNFTGFIDKEAGRIAAARNLAGERLTLLQGETAPAPFSYDLGHEIIPSDAANRGIAVLLYKGALKSLQASYPKRIADVNGAVVFLSSTTAGLATGLGTYGISGILLGTAAIGTAVTFGVVAGFVAAAVVICYKQTLITNSQIINAHAERVFALTDRAAQATANGTTQAQSIPPLDDLRPHRIVRRLASHYRSLLHERVKNVFGAQTGVSQASMQILPGAQPA